MNELARRYALALYECGEEETALTEASEGIMGSEELWGAFRNPSFHPNEKQAVLRALPLFSGQPRLLSFFCLLAEKSRLNLLPDILDEYHGLCQHAQNVASCQVYCVRALSEAQLERLRAALCKWHHKTDITFDFHIDPSLLGGFVLELEGVTYDQSVRGRLRGLNRYMEEVSAI